MKRLPELVFLNAVSSVPLQQVLRVQQKAFANFFAKRARFPVQVPSGRQPAEYTRSGFRWAEGALPLAKQGAPWRSGVVARLDPATLDPSTVTVSRDPDGRWYVSLAVDAPDPAPGRAGRCCRRCRPRVEGLRRHL